MIGQVRINKDRFRLYVVCSDCGEIIEHYYTEGHLSQLEQAKRNFASYMPSKTLNSDLIQWGLKPHKCPNIRQNQIRDELDSRAERRAEGLELQAHERE